MTPCPTSAPQRRITIAIADLRRGGAQRVAAWLAGALVERGYEVTLLLLGGPEQEQAFAVHPGVRIVHADILWPSHGLRRLPDFFSRIARIRRAVREARPQALLSFLDFVNVRVLSACLGLRLPTAVCERIDPRLYPLPRVWRVARGLLYPLAQALVIQAEGLREAWPARLSPSLRVIPNPVRRLEARGTVSLPPRTILSVARLDAQKGLDLLIRAFAQIGQEQDAFLVLAGVGPLRDELVALAMSLGVGDRVRLPGAVGEVGAWLEAAQIFVLSSHYEGQPNALAEAMAAGLPVVATDTPGALSLVRHGKNGLVVPRGDVDALAEAMRMLLTEPGRAAAMGQTAQGMATELCEERVLGLWVSLVDKLTGQADADSGS